METLTFSIEEVRHGWFVCRFGEAEICGSNYFWASNCCGHDGPRQLLKLLGELFRGEREGGYAVFEAEPGAYILSIQSGAQDSLSLWYTEKNLPDWYPMCPGTVRVLSELPRNLKPDEMLLSVGELDLYGFSCAVGDAFSAYIPGRMRDAYIKNWMPFPMEELAQLRRVLGDYPKNMLTEI